MNRENDESREGGTPPSPVTTLAILGDDYPGLRPALKVTAGESVQAGQVLMSDRAHPNVAIVAPLAGTVASVDYGPRRSLSALVLRGEQAAVGAPTSPPDMTSRAALRYALLSHGLWPALRTRPYGRFPDPDKVPDAIFVTATDSAPLAADPRALLAGQEQDFSAGVEALALLTDGPVFVCQSAGEPLATETPRIRNVVFDGPHPAGLASTHIQALHPVGFGQEVWTIDCQEVAAIGHLAKTGQHDPTRKVAITGTHLPQAKLVRTLPGTSLREIVGEEGRAISGSSLGGRGANWLGRFHRQITLVEPDVLATGPSWLRRRGKPGPMPRPIIPTASLNRALPRPFLPVPLMRALAVGDAEATARLGALSLIEEDMALLSFLCTSGADYGRLLRQVLDELEMTL